METFAPDAPNIWAGIEQGVQANAAAQTATITKTIGSKLVITIAKIAAILVIPASVIVYFVSNEKNNVVENKKVENTTTSSPSKIIETEKLTVATATENSNKKLLDNIDLKNEVLIAKNSLHQYQETENHISITNKSTNLEQAIVLNKIYIDKEKVSEKREEILLKEEVEEIEGKETQGEVYAAENAVGIKFLPNCFTPDNDGINDKYVIDSEGEKFYNLKIYNYNNELVFESNDKNNNWDGVNYKTGQACNSGTYYGIFQFKFSNEDKNSTRMLKIKLIR